MGLAKWKNEWYIKAFRLATDGMEDRDIAQVLGVPGPRFMRWIREDKALREGLAQARQSKTGYADFKSFIYERLPRKVRELWDELDGTDRLPDVDKDKKRKREAILDRIEREPVQWQQSLFLHALVKCNFIKTKACMKTGIAPGMVTFWCNNSEPFRLLVDGIEEHKKDFFESALIDLCRQGDSAAIIFANKTKNRDRGYSADININTAGTIQHKHAVDLESLPIEARRAILQAVRAKQHLLTDRSKETPSEDIVDAEVVQE